MSGASALDHGSPVASAWLDLPRGWLFEHIPDAVLVADVASGRIELANPAADRLFGFSAVGESVDQVAPGLLESAAWRSLLSEPTSAEPGRASVELSEVSLSRLDSRSGDLPSPGSGPLTGLLIFALLVGGPAAWPQ